MASEGDNQVKRLTLYTHDNSYSDDSSCCDSDEELLVVNSISSSLVSSRHNSGIVTSLRKKQSIYSRWYFRYLILIFVCVVKFIQNYIYEIPSGIENIIIQTLDVDVTNYSLLYSAYSWPNVVLPLVGGIIVDRVIGIRLGTMIFMCISLVGQLGFSLGGYFNSFILMVVSRFIIGVGSQMALVVTDAFAARWFKGKEIALMFGFLGVACRLGGVAGIYLNIIIYGWFSYVSNKHLQLSLTLIVPSALLFISTGLTVVLVILDKKGEKNLQAVGHNGAESGTKLIHSYGSRDRDCAHWWITCCVNFVKHFRLNFWLVCLMFLTFYASIFAFVCTSQLYFVSKFALSEKLANLAVGISYMMPMFSPLFGLAIDKTGSYISWGLFGGLSILFGAHTLFAFSNNQFYVPFVGNAIIGLSFVCFNTAMRVVPAILIEESFLVTAYGLSEVCQSIGYSANDIIVGALIDSHGYFAQEIYLLCFILVGILAGLLVLTSRANKCKLWS